uniref:30S ribosomal protein S7 n=1 Tax=Dictyotopsis propagulifera TaxID=670095 RepID=UPI002E7AA6D9|nr:30S ribosomal protein S7 [Dictyotopsis propagulifera]WAM63129.1 30S ribosomal protein S7 [Dictyotopsis propagulifera]
MSRRIKKKRKFPIVDPLYESYLVNLMILKILKNGKKRLAQNIIYEAFNLIKKKANTNPLKVFEKAIKNVSPSVKIQAKRVGGSTYQVPSEVKKFRGVNLGLSWILKYAKDRSGKTIAIRLANEILEASRGVGNSIRKKEETHRIARSNKAFAHFRK